MKKLLVRTELRELDRIAFRMYADVVRYLEAHGRKMYGLSLTDKYRLLKFRNWMERYKISLEFILDTLLPYYQRRFKTENHKKGLGVKVTTLTGKKSEQIISDKVFEQFPNGENISLARHDRITEIIARRTGEDDEFSPKIKTLLDFKSPEAYTRYYDKKTRRQSSEYLKETDRKENKLRRYRGSPWHQ